MIQNKKYFALLLILAVTISSCAHKNSSSEAHGAENASTTNQPNVTTDKELTTMSSREDEDIDKLSGEELNQRYMDAILKADINDLSEKELDLRIAYAKNEYKRKRKDFKAPAEAAIAQNSSNSNTSDKTLSLSESPGFYLVKNEQTLMRVPKADFKTNDLIGKGPYPWSLNFGKKERLTERDLFTSVFTVYGLPMTILNKKGLQISENEWIEIFQHPTNEGLTFHLRTNKNVYWVLVRVTVKVAPNRMKFLVPHCPEIATYIDLQDDRLVIGEIEDELNSARYLVKTIF